MNVVDSTGVDMLAHNAAMHETAEKLCGIWTKMAISILQVEELVS